MEQEGRIGGGAGKEREGDTKVHNGIGKGQLLLIPAGTFWGPTWLNVSLNVAPLPAPSFIGQGMVPLSITSSGLLIAHSKV